MMRAARGAAATRPRRECARRFCEKTFTPKYPAQKFCSRRCAFKQLYFSRHNDLWHGANDRAGGKYSSARYAKRDE